MTSCGDDREYGHRGYAAAPQAGNLAGLRDKADCRCEIMTLRRIGRDDFSRSSAARRKLFAIERIGTEIKRRGIIRRCAGL